MNPDLADWICRGFLAITIVSLFDLNRRAGLSIKKFLENKNETSV